MRYLYLLADRRGAWATLRAKPMPARVRGLRICYVGEYEDDAVAWRDFQAATRLAQVAGTLIYNRLMPGAPQAAVD
jgi:hypothetical protein